ncbi:unnamed protein product [Caretta caretta]
MLTTGTAGYKRLGTQPPGPVNPGRSSNHGPDANLEEPHSAENWTEIHHLPSLHPSLLVPGLAVCTARAC